MRRTYFKRYVKGPFEHAQQNVLSHLLTYQHSWTYSKVALPSLHFTLRHWQSDTSSSHIHHLAYNVASQRRYCDDLRQPTCRCVSEVQLSTTKSKSMLLTLRMCLFSCHLRVCSSLLSAYFWCLCLEPFHQLRHPCAKIPCFFGQAGYVLHLQSQLFALYRQSILMLSHSTDLLLK